MARKRRESFRSGEGGSRRSRPRFARKRKPAALTLSMRRGARCQLGDFAKSAVPLRLRRLAGWSSRASHRKLLVSGSEKKGRTSKGKRDSQTHPGATPTPPTPSAPRILHEASSQRKRVSSRSSPPLSPPLSRILSAWLFSQPRCRINIFERAIRSTVPLLLGGGRRAVEKAGYRREPALSPRSESF